MKIYNNFTNNTRYNQTKTNDVIPRYNNANTVQLTKDTVSFRASKIINLPESILSKCKTTIKKILPNGSNNNVRPKDLMDLPEKQIIEICQNALKKQIPLGRGQEATVYKIEEFPREYCIREDRRICKGYNNLKLSYNLDKFDKANFVIAKLGQGLTLLKYISGIPLKIMRNSDTISGIKVKESMQELIANNFPEESFIKVLDQIERNRANGIVFDRKGENLLVDPMIQEITAIDFSPKFNDIEYNPIAYIYHALDVDGTPFAPKVLGKLMNAYAERLKTCDLKDLNLDVLDKNFYYRGFMDDAFNKFKDRELLEKCRTMLFDDLLEAKKTMTESDFNAKVEYFKFEIENLLIDPLETQRYEIY